MMASRPVAASALVLGLLAIIGGALAFAGGRRPSQGDNHRGMPAHTAADCEVDEGYVQPNIIFFLADDLGFNDVGWNNPDAVSPYLDDLAANGVILDRNYVHPVCSPSRGALQTGKYAFHLGLQHLVILTEAADCLDLNEKLIGQAMKDLGYSTHMLGKWHLGFCNWDCTPNERGYDTFYGFYNGYVDHITHMIDGWYDWRDDREPVVENNGTYATDLIADRAAQLIMDDDGSAPMFMMVAMATTHIPIQLPNGDTYAPGDDERDMFLGMVTAMDNDVKTVVEALKEKGYYDNSIIIFSADNGGELGGSSNYPLRGTKASSYEGGTRVAGMVHSPLQTATGIKSEEMFHITDWFPTMVELGGGCADDPAVDGMSQVEMIMHGGASVRNEVVYHLDGNTPPLYGYGAIRVDNYKLMLGFPGLYDGWEQDDNLGLTYNLDLLDVNDQFVTSGHEKRSAYVLDFAAIAVYANSAKDHVYLFDVVADPEERNNIAADNPDIVETMTARLMEFFENEAPINPDGAFVDPNARKAEYNEIWTPGWCEV